ncbi:hypothetical protein EV424DRAFT_1304208, partial [Suillus variegatus]
VFKWLVKNDGAKFQDTDWKRLTKIAEGNLDERKIGAFGVGTRKFHIAVFFSVFSVTDKPTVKSNGTRCLNEAYMLLIGCYRKDGIHFLRWRPEPLNCDLDKWTAVIEMELKQESTIPRIFELTRFLVTSATFLSHIQCVTVMLDDTELSCLTK